MIIGAYAWMTPMLQPDWNVEGYPYHMQVQVYGWAYDETGHGLGSQPAGYEAMLEGAHIEGNLDVIANETTTSLRNKVIAFIRAAYAMPNLPVTFIMDAPGS